jgi:hypothetical protein
MESISHSVGQERQRQLWGRDGLTLMSQSVVNCAQEGYPRVRGRRKQSSSSRGIVESSSRRGGATRGRGRSVSHLLRSKDRCMTL